MGPTEGSSSFLHISNENAFVALKIQINLTPFALHPGLHVGFLCFIHMTALFLRIVNEKMNIKVICEGKPAAFV